MTGGEGGTTGAGGLSIGGGVAAAAAGLAVVWAVHHGYGSLVVAAAVAAAVLAAAVRVLVWAFIPRRSLPRNRVRHARWRARLRLHPGRGHATAVELHMRWGRFAAFRKSHLTRPSLTAMQRLRHPDEHSVKVGRAHYRHGLRVPLEEHFLVLAPPRARKTAWLARMILHYPGPVVSTSTKDDVFQLTSGVRAMRGPVQVLNPQRLGGVPSTFRWNPIPGCEDPATAIRRADGFVNAVSHKGLEDATYWAGKASDWMRGLFCAAAVSGGDMRHVAWWALGPQGTSVRAEQILDSAGYSQWAAQLAEMRGSAEKSIQSIKMTLSRALGFMADPALLDAVLPTFGGGLDIEAFLEEMGTLYLIASSQDETSPLAPLFSCLTGEIHYQAGVLGSCQERGRLDPTLLLALDEATQICPVPLPQWFADSGGKGIQIAAVAHGEAQLEARWEHHGRQAIMDTAGVKLLLPGITDPQLLETASTLCGEAAYTEPGQEHVARHAVMTPAMIRSMPAGYGLVLRGPMAPVVARLPVAWKDRTYRRARRAGLAVAPLVMPGPAIALTDAAAAELGMRSRQDPFGGQFPGGRLPWDDENPGEAA